MTIIAIDDKIVVKQMIKNVTKGGLIIPGQAKMEPQVYGRVVSVGENVKQIMEGDLIMFHPKGGMAVVMENSILSVVKYDEVYAIVRDKEIEDQLMEAKIGE